MKRRGRERGVIKREKGREREKEGRVVEGNGVRERWGRREGGREKIAGIIGNQKLSSSKLHPLTSA